MRCVIVGEGSSRLSVLSDVPPLSLSEMYLTIRGSGYLICSHSPSGSSSLEDSLFARTWVLPSCSFFSPFVGCFVLLIIGKSSSSKVA